MVQFPDAPSDVAAVVGAVRLPSVTDATPARQAVCIADEDFFRIKLFESWRRGYFSVEDLIFFESRDVLSELSRWCRRVCWFLGDFGSGAGPLNLGLLFGFPDLF